MPPAQHIFFTIHCFPISFIFMKADVQAWVQMASFVVNQTKKHSVWLGHVKRCQTWQQTCQIMAITPDKRNKEIILIHFSAVSSPPILFVQMTFFLLHFWTSNKQQCQRSSTCSFDVWLLVRCVTMKPYHSPEMGSKTVLGNDRHQHKPLLRLFKMYNFLWCVLPVVTFTAWCSKSKLRHGHELLFCKTTFYYYFSLTENAWLVLPQSIYVIMLVMSALQCCGPNPACRQWAKSWSSSHEWLNCQSHFFFFPVSVSVLNIFASQPSSGVKQMDESTLNVK